MKEKLIHLFFKTQRSKCGIYLQKNIGIVARTAKEEVVNWFSLHNIKINIYIYC